MAQSRKKNPRQDLEEVKKTNQEIHDWLEANQEELRTGELAVLVIDECHLMSGEICGYGWGDRKQRRTVEVGNYRDRQTYYGAIDLYHLQKAKTADGEQTVDFIKYLQRQRPKSRLLIIWDGASYHRQGKFQEYLAQINGENEENWLVHCHRFAPYAPEENPIENIWSQGKNFLRRFHHFCKSFAITKKIFELFIHYQLFTMPNLDDYEAFSHLF
ncbi:MAG: transposase [Cyanobacteria bacterium]|nr:transposase [Cyanobacteria bacterium GSL.Bin21]